MTIDQKSTIDPKDVRDALPKAKILVREKWLRKQSRKRSASPNLVNPQNALFSRKQALAAMRHDFPKAAMHPIAECILDSERALADFDKGIATYPRPENFIRLLSLRDIADARNRLPGIDERIRKLVGNEWHVALFELLTAVSYPEKIGPQFLSENSDNPIADIRLDTHPFCDVECKSKLQYEQKVVEFVETWRKTQLSQIHKTLVPGPESYIVRVEIDSLDSFGSVQDGEIAEHVSAMLQRNLETYSDKKSYSVQVERRSSTRKVFSPPVPLEIKRIWGAGWDFDEWSNWHYILPTGDVAIKNGDNRSVGGYGQRVLICVRANELRNNTLSVMSALKDACRRQLRTSETGIVHLSLSASLFGLGDLQRPEIIKRKLHQEIDKLFSDYSRVWRVYVDVTHENTDGSFTGSRISATNRRAAFPRGFEEPKPFLFA